jgi:hypothetical protein
MLKALLSNLFAYKTPETSHFKFVFGPVDLVLDLRSFFGLLGFALESGKRPAVSTVFGPLHF